MAQQPFLMDERGVIVDDMTGPLVLKASVEFGTVEIARVDDELNVTDAGHLPGTEGKGAGGEAPGGAPHRD